MKKLLMTATVVFGFLVAAAPAWSQTVLSRAGWVATASPTNGGEPQEGSL